jgi:hypothetical protein
MRPTPVTKTAVAPFIMTFVSRVKSLLTRLRRVEKETVVLDKKTRAFKGALAFPTTALLNSIEAYCIESRPLQIIRYIQKRAAGHDCAKQLCQP